MTGQLFGDRYQVGDTLGFGGMSEVHRGRDLRLGRDVAIKVLRADLARDPSFQTRFRREAQNAASLNHPAIVAVYDTGETAGETGTIPYIVMEYVDGETLRDLLKREGSLEPKRAMEIVADVCAALDFSHRHGIVHRDIKPANVMLTRAGAVKVMDFGIARAVADGQATMTATAAVIGTAQYLSPEQARGEAVDARSDVYATGCVLFELLVGAPPFTGDSPVAVAYQHVREDARAPSEVKPGLPRELDSIVLKALNKNPLNRYQTAAEMRADLVRALSGQAVHATPFMSDEERTQIMRATPERVGLAVAPVPSLLAPPRRAMADEVWDEDEPDRSKRVWGFVGIGVLCLALLAGAIFLTLKVTGAPTKQPQIAAPGVQGLTLQQAEKAITEAGLTVGSTIAVPSSTVPSGTVVKQNPSEGTFVDRNKPVNLEVSKGIVNVVVPNLAQLSAAAAQAQLEEMNLLAKPVQVPSTDGQKNTVVSQNPKAGVSVKPGSTVTYAVGSGPVFTKVPADLLGKSFDQASAELTALKLSAVPQQVDGVQPVNQVVKLVGVKAGDNVQQGTPITLQVSNNQLFTVPNLANLTPDDAAIRLQALKWKGKVTDFGLSYVETVDLSQVGTIADGPQIVNNALGGGSVQKPAQAPAVNAIAKKDVHFDIVVYAKKKIVLPNFTPGVTTVDEVKNTILGLGATQATVITRQPAPPPAVPYTFISIDPAANGSPIDFDTPITVYVWGSPPPPPTTPKPPTTPPSTAGSSTTSSSGSTTSSSSTAATTSSQQPTTVTTPPGTTARASGG